MARAQTEGSKKKAVKKTAKKSNNAGGTTSKDRILEAIASRASCGNNKPDRKVIMGMAVIYNVRSYNTTLLDIKKKTGFIDYDKTSVWLTAKGKEHIGEDALAIPATNDAMQDKIRSEMIKGSMPRKIYDIMLDGEWHTRAELAENMDVENNRSFGTYVSALSKVVEREGKRIRLSDLCFPCGRP